MKLAGLTSSAKEAASAVEEVGNAASKSSSAVADVAEASTSTASAVAEVGAATATSSASMTTMEAATAGLAAEETVATGATVGFGTAIKGFLVTVAPIAAALVAVGAAFKLAHDYVTKFDTAVEKAETSQSIDNYGCETLCTVFYNTDTKEYKIIAGGFMYMKVYKDLDVVIDCKNMTIEDSIGRMVTYDKLGISDVGYMYWLRLMNGNNSIMFHGNCEFTIEHIEARKVGE